MIGDRHGSAVGVMLAFAEFTLAISLTAIPAWKVLALSFLLLIGVMLIADGMGQHIAKGDIYFAMGF